MEHIFTTRLNYKHSAGVFTNIFPNHYLNVSEMIRSSGVEFRDGARFYNPEE